MIPVKMMKGEVIVVRKSGLNLVSIDMPASWLCLITVAAYVVQ